MKLIFNLLKRVYQNEKILIIFIFCLSIIFSLIFFLFLKNIGPVEHQTPNTDYLVRYEPIADSILEGKGIRLNGKVEPGFAPGFSVVLAGLFALSNQTGIARLDLIVLMNIILGAFTACLVFFLAKEVFSKKNAIVASITWMTYPFNLWFLKSPNSEVPFMPFFCLGIFLFILSFRNNNLKFVFLSGLMLGISSLIRLPTLFFALFLVLLVFFIFKSFPLKRKFLLVVILLMGNFFAVFPWGIYSFLNTGSFIPVSNLASSGLSSGFTFLLGTNKSDDRIILSGKTREKLEELEGQEQLGNGTLALLSAFRDDPGIFLRLTWLRITRVWYGTGMMWWEHRILAVQSLYLLAAFAGMIFALRKYKDKIRYFILFLCIILYFWCMAFLTISILRYMIPAMVFVIIFSAVGASLTWIKLKEKLNFKN